MSTVRSTQPATSFRSMRPTSRWNVIAFGDLDERAFLDRLALHVAAINKGIEGIPRDRVRLHVCWGNNDGPHIHDIAMATILPELYRAEVGALSVSRNWETRSGPARADASTPRQNRTCSVGRKSGRPRGSARRRCLCRHRLPPAWRCGPRLKHRPRGQERPCRLFHRLLGE